MFFVFFLLRLRSEFTRILTILLGSARTARIRSDCVGEGKVLSTLIVSHGADGIGRGCSSPVGGCQNDLV